MTELAVLDNLVERICDKGEISHDDVGALRQTVFPDGVVSAAEMKAVFRMDHACPIKDDMWPQFYVDALTDYFVWQTTPRGYVSEELATALIQQIQHDGHVDSLSELELLLNILRWAALCPESLALLTLRAVQDSILTPSQACYGENRPPAVITPADVEIMRKVLYAPGGAGGFTVTRQEAEMLFDLNDATKDQDNASSWQDLFAKSIANYLMFPRGAPAVPTAEAEQRRATWLKDRRSVGEFLRRVVQSFARLNVPFKGATQDLDIFGTERARVQKDREDAQMHEAFARESIDHAEAQWLAVQVLRDGDIDANERHLLKFIQANAPKIDPALQSLLAKAGL